MTFPTSSRLRVDARDKVKGTALYPGDITPSNLLYGKVLFSHQPHARMLSIDTSAAEAVTGVVTILTAADVPVNEYGLIMPDQPVLVGLGSNKAHSDVSRWEGDQVAVVVAESETAAVEAANLIAIEWEQLPIVTDVFEALKEDVLVMPWQGDNVLKKYQIRKGDMAAGWAEADVVVEDTYYVPFQEHAYLQPEAGLGYIDENGRITIEIAGQWTHEDQLQVAHALDVPVDQVRIIYPAIGGAFGGREDMSLQIVLGLAAMRLQAQGIKRPVRIIWSREESIIGHHKRHQAVIKTKWGATKDGKITAVSAEAYMDSGAYAYTSTKVLGNLQLTVAGPYEVPNAHIDSYAIATHNVPGGAFRGFGGPQGAFAAENQMNRLAVALGLDPVAIRQKNILRDESILITQTPMPTAVSLSEVLDQCADDAGWAEPLTSAPPFQPFQTLPVADTAVKRGRGIACAFKNIGFSFGFPERCEATIDLYGAKEIERVVLYHAGADVGQGAHTVFLQMAAAALNVPETMVELDLSDTVSSGDSGSASASRMTFMAGNAIRGAAEAALAAWQNEERPARGHFRYIPPPTEPFDPETGICTPNFSYGYVAEVAEVTVDTETGHIRVDRVICANDVGKALNPNLIEGQIEGAVVQAHGYALTENLQVKNGRIQNPYFSQYLIPGIKDIPTTVESVIMEIPDPLGPWGARGMAEMPFLPLAPAITAAIHDATGVWFNQIPLTPARVAAKLKSKDKSSLANEQEGPLQLQIIKAQTNAGTIIERVTYKQVDNQEANAAIIAPEQNQLAAGCLILHEGHNDVIAEAVALHKAAALSQQGIITVSIDVSGISFADAAYLTAYARRALLLLTTHDGVDNGRLAVIGHGRGGVVAAMLTAVVPAATVIFTRLPRSVAGIDVTAYLRQSKANSVLFQFFDPDDDIPRGEANELLTITPVPKRIAWLSETSVDEAVASGDAVASGEAAHEARAGWLAHYLIS